MIGVAKSEFGVVVLRSAITFFILVFLQEIGSCAEPFVVRDTSMQMTSLTRHLSIMDDSSGKVSVEDIASGKYADRFSDHEHTLKFAHFTSSAIWAHCSIFNDTDEEARLVVESSMARLSHARWHLIENGDVRVSRFGGAKEIQQGLAAPVQYPHISFSVAPNQTVDLYFVAKSDTFIWFPMVIGSEDSFGRFDRLRLMQDFFLLAVCIIIMAILLTFGTANRKILFLMISMFTLAYSIRFLLFNGHVRTVRPDLPIWWERQFYGFITALSVSVVFSIDRNILGVATLPRWASRLRLFVILLLASGVGVSLIIEYRWSVKYLFSISSAFTVLYMVVCLCAALRQRTTLSWIWFSIGLVISVDLVVQQINQSVVIPYSRRNFIIPTGFGLFMIWFGTHQITLIQTKLRLSESMRAEAEARLLALRSQLDPHLLFNSLTSIDALSRDNPSKVPELVEKLASFLRFRLTNSQSLFRPLKEEIDALHAYLDIEMVRYGDDLKVVFDTDKEADAWDVPEFILQPLVENAIKHGFQADQPIELVVKSMLVSGQLVLEVSNLFPLQSDLSSQGGFGIGISNTRDRLKCLYGNIAKFELFEIENVFTARLWIPEQKGAIWRR
ncbi:MAG: histidine kinase [Pirellula sp.]|jgi:hypothetical protein